VAGFVTVQLCRHPYRLFSCFSCSCLPPHFILLQAGRFVLHFRPTIFSVKHAAVGLWTVVRISALPATLRTYESVAEVRTKKKLLVWSCGPSKLDFRTGATLWKMFKLSYFSNGKDHHLSRGRTDLSSGQRVRTVLVHTSAVDCVRADMQLRTKISWKICGYGLVELLASSCRGAIANKGQRMGLPPGQTSGKPYFVIITS
jgi:hypothetical protein